MENDRLHRLFAPDSKPELAIVRLVVCQVDGAHFIASPDVRGLCAAAVDLSDAWREAGVQLAELCPVPGED